MAHYKASGNKREQFRRYLEKTGVVDSLTSVFLALYEDPERPPNPLDFVKQHLHASGEDSPDSKQLLREVMDLRQRCTRLTEENKLLKRRLQQYKSGSEDGATAE